MSSTDVRIANLEAIVGALGIPARQMGQPGNAAKRVIALSVAEAMLAAARREREQRVRLAGFLAVEAAVASALEEVQDEF